MTLEPAGVADLVREAETRIREHVRETPLEPSPLFGRLGGAEVFFKCENLQYTGSFKIRGAMNKLLTLRPETLADGVVAASTGNHGAAVAYGSSRLGIEAEIFVPETTSSSKVDAIRLAGARVVFHGRDGVEAEMYARRYANRNARSYISPYNDPQVIAGQGTLGVEILGQLPEVDAVFVALGGGGLISGVAAYLKWRRPEVTVIGCSPRNSAVMIESLRAGRILELPSKPTLSDGTAGGVEAGAITFDLCRELVDDFETVSEEEIEEALRLFIGSHHQLIEGAAGVAIAAYLKRRESLVGRRTVIVLCGANISLEDLGRVLM